MDFHDPATTYAEALDNLTEENWHRERALIEAEVLRLRLFLEDVSNTKSIDLAQGTALLALSGAPHVRGEAVSR